MYESIVNFNSVQMGADVEKNPGATCTLTVQSSNCTIYCQAKELVFIIRTTMCCNEFSQLTA